MPRAELSFHQRLTTRVEIKVDGRDLETRRGDGHLVFLIQITDPRGSRYRNHGDIDLSKLDANIRAANVEYSQRAFFLPGDYQLAVALLDTATGEHSTRQEQFRVTPPPHEFLAAAWRNLPPVEFIGKDDAPDGWFLPEIQGRLQWAAAVHAAARLDVILNVAPSAVHRSNSGDLGALLPTLKALTETGSRSVSEHIELLDLSRRHIAFNQNPVRDLDWTALKESLGESSTASIDIHSLEERHHDAQFFVTQVRAVLRASQQPCVLVVLSAPVAFESGEDLAPVSLEALPACRVLYVRYRARVEFDRAYTPQFAGRDRGARIGGGPIARNGYQQIVDQLEGTLKPLNPKVYDVGDAEQITKTFVEIEKALQ